MKTAISSLLAIVSIVLVSSSARAEEQVYVSLQNQGNVILNRAADLADPGTVMLNDNEGVPHPADARSILALLSQVDETAAEFDISVLKYYPQYSAFFLECIDVPGPVCGWWQYVVDGVYGQVGMDQYVLQGGETVYIYFDSYQEQASFPVRSTGPSGSSFMPFSDPVVPHKELDEAKAAAFLRSLQNEDGSFGNAALYSDWAAIAVGAYGDEEAKEKLAGYLLSYPDPGTLLTDYERRAMAMLALGLNPYSSAPVNYIQKIIDEFDGTQFGNPDLLNDDIFAIIPLVKAGYTNSDKEIQSSVAFLLKTQAQDGSWGKDVDLTAAAIQALSLVSSTSDVQNALLNARTYLKSKQDDRGGFKNAYSTAWAMQAISALGEHPGSWVQNNRTPEDYLQFFQASDGGLRMQEDDSRENRLWMTSYALPAVLQKPWGSALRSVQKQISMDQEPVAVAPPAEQIAPIIQESAPISQAPEPVVAVIDEAQLIAIQEQIAAIQVQIALLQAELQELPRSSFAVAPPAEVQQEVFAEQKEAESIESPLAKIAEVQELVVQEQEEEQELLVASVEQSASSLPVRGIAFAVLAGFAIFMLAGGTKTLVLGARKLFAKA